jgi:hypothetical protein
MLTPTISCWTARVSSAGSSPMASVRSTRPSGNSDSTTGGMAGYGVSSPSRTGRPSSGWPDTISIAAATSSGLGSGCCPDSSTRARPGSSSGPVTRIARLLV